MSSRPLVTVYDGITGEAEKKAVTLPAVFLAPVRGDIVHFVFRNQNKNKRQPEAVSTEAGKQHSAISWGTGRAVARIPRISGSGSGRNGQGAFGNMTRKGHMFSPLKVWRRWQVKTPKQLKRYAVASCIAASSIPALVAARGHKIEAVPQIPLVINSKSFSVCQKTKEAVYLLKKVGAYADVLRAIASKSTRAGQGKMRGRLTRTSKGPLIVYGNENVQALRAFRNIPGVDSCNVDCLSVLKLAPGGHMGRFVIWTESAFKRLAQLFGTQTHCAELKSGFRVPTAQMAVPDIKRAIHAAEKAKILRAKKAVVHAPKRVNPLKNWAAMVKLNPYALIAKNKMSQIAASKAKAKKAYAEKIEKILAAKKVAMTEATKQHAVKAKRNDKGKLVHNKVAKDLLKPVVKRSAKAQKYMKHHDVVVKAQIKEYNKKIAL